MIPDTYKALAFDAADAIDREQPELRPSGERTSDGKGWWILAVAARAATLALRAQIYGVDFGVKRADSGRPWSIDTLAIRDQTDNLKRFYCLSLCEDREGYPRRSRTAGDHGLVSGQIMEAVAPDYVKPDPDGGDEGTGEDTGQQESLGQDVILLATELEGLKDGLNAVLPALTTAIERLTTQLERAIGVAKLFR